MLHIQVMRRALLAMREAVLLRRERAQALLTARARVITIQMHVAFNAWYLLTSLMQWLIQTSRRTCMSCLTRANHSAVVRLAMCASSDAAGHKHRHLQLVRLSAGQGIS